MANEGLEFKFFNNKTKQFEAVRTRTYKGFLIRNIGADKMSINECLANYPTEVSGVDYAGKTVMDLGSNIGGFVKIAEKAGADRVIAYEPCPHNFLVQIRNCSSLNYKFCAAVTEKADPYVPFYYADKSSINAVSSSTVRKSANQTGEVLIDSVNFQFSEIIQHYKPEIVKIDIEGGEYSLLDSLRDGKIPDFVNTMFVEFHTPRLTPSYVEKYFPESDWTVSRKSQVLFKKEQFFDYLMVRK